MVFFSLQMQRKFTQKTKYTTCFFTLFIKRQLTNFLKQQLRKNFYVISTTCFNECFLFNVITKRLYFLKKFIVALSFFSSHAVASCFERSPYSIRYLHNNSTMLITMFENKYAFVYYTSYTLWPFHTFLYK